MNDYYTSILVNRILGERTGIPLVGVTGCMGSGKSTFCQNLLGYSNISGRRMNYLNFDELVKTLYTGRDSSSEKVLSKLRDHFGAQIFDKKKLNLKKLGAIVFNDPLGRERLAEIITIPLLESLRPKLANKTDITLVDAAYFTEYHLLSLVNHNIILVSCDEPERVARVMKRDNITLEQFEARASSQHTPEEKRSLILEAQVQVDHGFFFEVNTSRQINYPEVIAKLEEYFRI